MRLISLWTQHPTGRAGSLPAWAKPAVLLLVVRNYMLMSLCQNRRVMDCICAYVSECLVSMHTIPRHVFVKNQPCTFVRVSCAAVHPLHSVQQVLFHSVFRQHVVGLCTAERQVWRQSPPNQHLLCGKNQIYTGVLAPSSFLTHNVPPATPHLHLRRASILLHCSLFCC